MKKMNRKGFTLIELLAVIVVLAIILVITIPTVLNTLGSTRTDAFAASANSVAEWFEKEYSLDQADLDDKVSKAYTAWSSGKTLTTANAMSAATLDGVSYDVLKAAGLNTTDYSTESTVQFTADGRVCVTLKATETGKFKDVKWEVKEGDNTVEKTAVSDGIKSSACQ